MSSCKLSDSERQARIAVKGELLGSVRDQASECPNLHTDRQLVKRPPIVFSTDRDASKDIGGLTGSRAYLEDFGLKQREAAAKSEITFR